MRRIAALTALAALAGCNVDALLEEKVPPPVYLTMAVTTTALTLAPGGTSAVEASITRLGDYVGAVGFAFSNVPDGVTATLGAFVTSGKVTTSTITFVALPTAPVGTHFITVRGTVGPDTKTSQQIALVVTPVPAIGVLPAAQSLAIIRGGIAPLRVTLMRTSVEGPVALSLTGAEGIALSEAAAPVTGNSANVTISVAASVAPGSYNATLRAGADGVEDATAPVTIIVPADPLQIIVDHAATSQASVVTTPVIVNRFGADGAVTIAAENMPAGMTATVPAGAATGATADVRFSVGASVAPGAYSVVLRGQSASVPDAITSFVLTVGPSNVAMTLVPQNVTMLQGTSAASTLQLIRTSFLGAVSVQVLAVPPGISISATDQTVTGASTTLVVQATRELTPGSYPVSIRVVPAPSEVDGPALNPVTTTLTVTVVEAPTVDGNVLLDWSACVAPGWVAAKNGTDPWTRLTGAQGRFSFALTSSVGGFAYDDGGTGIVVRFMTSTELTAGPIDLCPASPPNTYSVTGTAQHTALTEQFTWRMGGGVGLSTLAAPNYTITGVRSGETHDLIGWGSAQAFGQRMFIQRDVNLPPGGDVGVTSLASGTGTFAPIASSFAFPGLSNDRVAITVSYHTTAACTENELYQLSFPGFISGSVLSQIFNVPAAQQRPTDFHRVSIFAASSSGFSSRTASLSFHARSGGQRAIPLPPNLGGNAVPLTGSHLRLRAVITAIPSAYNGTLTLRYSNGSRSGTVSASIATFAPGGVVLLDMPDFGSVEGFPMSSAGPVGSQGTYSVVVDASSGPSLCVEGATRHSWTRTGTF